MTLVLTVGIYVLVKQFNPYIEGLSMKIPGTVCSSSTTTQSTNVTDPLPNTGITPMHTPPEFNVADATVAQSTCTKNKGDYTELDISDELWREVTLADGLVVRIENPVKLFFRKGGTTHRVICADGTVHCYADPSTGKSAVRWMPKS